MMRARVASLENQSLHFETINP